MEYVQSDVLDPIQIPSKDGTVYFFTFIDGYCRKVRIYFMKQKSNVFAVFKQWKAKIEKQRKEQ